MALVRQSELFWKHDLTAVAAFITRENIDGLLEQNDFVGDIGLLSIDIDGNDYWVLEAIDAIQPIILICEYNPILGDTVPVAVPYDPDFIRFDTHYSGLYFGASIGAIRHAAEKKGYAFVGTNSHGINAFFVRKDHFEYVGPLLRNIRCYPSRHRDSRDEAGALSYAAGAERLELIKDMPVIRIEDGSEVLLSTLIPYIRR